MRFLIFPISTSVSSISPVISLTSASCLTVAAAKLSSAFSLLALRSSVASARATSKSSIGLEAKALTSANLRKKPPHDPDSLKLLMASVST